MVHKWLYIIIPGSVLLRSSSGIRCYHGCGSEMIRNSDAMFLVSVNSPSAVNMCGSSSFTMQPCAPFAIEKKIQGKGCVSCLITSVSQSESKEGRKIRTRIFDTGRPNFPCSVRFWMRVCADRAFGCSSSFIFLLICQNCTILKKKWNMLPLIHYELKWRTVTSKLKPLIHMTFLFPAWWYPCPDGDLKKK